MTLVRRRAYASLVTRKIARLVAFCVVVAGAVGHAAEVPDEVSASKCSGKRKAFGFIDDPTAPSRPYKFRMKSAFYFQAGSVAVSACKPFKGQSTCQEGMTLGFFGPFLLLALAIFTIIGLQYLVWGWLFERIYRSNPAADQVEAPREVADRDRLPPPRREIL